MKCCRHAKAAKLDHHSHNFSFFSLLFHFFLVIDFLRICHFSTAKICKLKLTGGRRTLELGTVESVKPMLNSVELIVNALIHWNYFYLTERWFLRFDCLTVQNVVMEKRLELAMGENLGVIVGSFFSFVMQKDLLYESSRNQGNSRTVWNNLKLKASLRNRN